MPSRLRSVRRGCTLLAHACLRLTALVVVAACAGGDSGGSVSIRGDGQRLDQPPTVDSIRSGLSDNKAMRDSMLADIEVKRQSLNTSPELAAAAVAAPTTGPKAGTSSSKTAPRTNKRSDSLTSVARNGAQKILEVESNAARRAKGDSARGVVALIGGSTAPQLVLHTSGNVDVALSGMATAGMSKLAGVEVVVRGFKVSTRDVVVSDYIVRAMNGVPAFDGILNSAGASWELTLTDGSGKKRLSVVPPTLRTAVGTRVWVSLRPGNNTPDAFGLIRRQ